MNIKNLHLANLPEKVRQPVQRFVTGGASGMDTRFLHGVDKKRELIHFSRGNCACIRRYVKPHDPKTHHQIPQRERWPVANRLWTEISAEQRRGWQEYAVKYGLDEQDAIPRQAGQHTFIKVQMTRMNLGWEMRHSPPTFAPPVKPLAISQEAVTGPNMLSFRLNHTVQDMANWRVKVEMSPASLRITRKPRHKLLVWACGVNIHSCPELLPSGEVYTLTGVRHRIEPGQRYGVRVSLITPDGLAGPELLGDFIRGDFIAPEEPAPSPLELSEMVALEMDARVSVAEEKNNGKSKTDAQTHDHANSYTINWGAYGAVGELPLIEAQGLPPPD